MGKEIKNIEDLFKSSFEGHKIEPSEKVWSNINSKLKYKYLSAKVFGSIAVIATIVVLSVFMSNIFDDKVINLSNQLPPISKSKMEQSTEDFDLNKNQRTDIKNIETGTEIQLGQKSENLQTSGSENKRKGDLAPVITSKIIKVLFVNDIDSLNIKATPPPSPVFTVKSQEGCVPFKLELENHTKSAITFEWSFGDGHTSNELVPNYTYRYPGVYRVGLKAVGFGGVAVTYIDSIVVHDSPIANVYWPYESAIQTGQKIMIPNKSKDISKVEWNYGDKCFSNELNGNHIFTKEGEYTITLKVWSANNCTDSAVLNNIKVIDTKCKIAFPNAFTPNIDGAASGYYSKTDKYNDVFYPKVNAKVLDYEIRIFSKAGIEVFKSKDIAYGWNGYYQNRLLPEGVYLYIVAGEFEGGQKFYNKGNITILHKK